VSTERPLRRLDEHTKHIKHDPTNLRGLIRAGDVAVLTQRSFNQELKELWEK